MSDAAQQLQANLIPPFIRHSRWGMRAALIGLIIGVCAVGWLFYAQSRTNTHVTQIQQIQEASSVCIEHGYRNASCQHAATISIKACLAYKPCVSYIEAHADLFQDLSHDPSH